MKTQKSAIYYPYYYEMGDRPERSMQLSYIRSRVCEEYKWRRFNGYIEDFHPRNKPPFNGKITWIKGHVKDGYVYGEKNERGHGYYEYECRYDEGEDDRKWMEANDIKYLKQLLWAGKLKETEPDVWYLRKMDKAQGMDIGEWWSQKLNSPDISDKLKLALNKQLLKAAKQGKLNKARSLINKGADVNYKESYSALMLAAKHDHLETVNLLIENGASIAERSKRKGNTAFMIAALYGHKNIMESLYKAYKTTSEKKAAIQEKNNAGDTSLLLASRRGNTDCAKWLLSHKVNIDDQNNDGDSALILAAREGHLEIGNLLIEKKANPNLVNKKGRTALLVAFIAGDISHIGFVNPLIQAGADVNAIATMDETIENGSLLHFALLFDHTEVAKQLIAHGANVNAKATIKGDNCGIIKDMMPLHFALFCDHTEIAEQLIEHGADVNAKVTIKTTNATAEDETPLHSALDGDHTEVARQLIEHGADVNAIKTVKMDEGRIIKNVTPFYSALLGDHIEVAKQLIKHKHMAVNAKAIIKLDEGRIIKDMMPLHLALFCDHTEIAEQLIEHGANVNAMATVKDGDNVTIEEGSPLHFALLYGDTIFSILALFGRREVVKQLIEQGADINSVAGMVVENGETIENATPLCLAVWKGNIDMTKYFCNKGADLTIKSSCGTALEIAQNKGLSKIVEFLESPPKHEERKASEKGQLSETEAQEEKLVQVEEDIKSTNGSNDYSEKQEKIEDTSTSTSLGQLSVEELPTTPQTSTIQSQPSSPFPKPQSPARRELFSSTSTVTVEDSAEESKKDNTQQGIVSQTEEQSSNQQLEDQSEEDSSELSATETTPEYHEPDLEIDETEIQALEAPKIDVKQWEAELEIIKRQPTEQILSPDEEKIFNEYCRIYEQKLNELSLRFNQESKAKQDEITTQIQALNQYNKEKEASLRNQIDELKTRINEIKSSGEQQTKEEHSKRLELESKQRELEQELSILQQEFEPRKEMLQARKNIYQRPALKTFYIRVQSELINLFLGSKSLASKLIRRESNKGDAAIKCLSKVGTFVPLPGAGMVTSAIGMGVQYFHDQYQSKKIARVTELVITLEEIDKLAELTARKLTYRYQNQLSIMPQAIVEEKGKLAVEIVRKYVESNTITDEREISDQLVEAVVLQENKLLQLGHTKRLTKGKHQRRQENSHAVKKDLERKLTTSIQTRVQDESFINEKLPSPARIKEDQQEKKRSKTEKERSELLQRWSSQIDPLRVQLNKERSALEELQKQLQKEKERTKEELQRERKAREQSDLKVQEMEKMLKILMSQMSSSQSHQAPSIFETSSLTFFNSGNFVNKAESQNEQHEENRNLQPST